MSGRVSILVRLLGALVLVALLVQLHACSTKADEKLAEARSQTKRSETDPRALFRIGNDIVTGPDARPVRARFTAEGAQLARATDGARMTMRLRSVGRAGSTYELATHTTPMLEAARISYAREGLTEWYEPKLEGLEQGAIVHTRPVGAGVLRVDVEIDPELEPVASKVDGCIDILREGVPSFRYGNLTVVDAAGARLSAKLETGGMGRIRISIDDASATYPITIDPLIWALQTKLVSLDPAPDDAFGADVAIQGDNIVVGLGARHGFAGGVAFYRRNGKAWAHEKLIEYANVPHGRNFGAYVSVDGDEALVGSENAGAIVKRANGTWSMSQVLQPPFILGGGFFGAPVALKGNVATISVRQHDAALLPDGGVIDGGADGGPPSAGAIFVYERSGSTWSPQATIPLPYLLSPGFYARVAIDGDTLVAGVGFHVVVFRRAPDGTWNVEAVFPKQHPTEFIGVFGQDVGIVGDVMVATDYPLVEVFQRKNGQWTLTQTIIPTNIGASQFGTAVALSANNLFVGDPALGGTGSVFRYRLVNGLFALEEQFVPPSATTASHLGGALDATNETAVFGAPQEGALAGAVYVYALSSSLGEACATDDACASGHCVDGVCCDTACGGGDSTDCLRCNGALTRGTCSPASSGVECRSATNECDLPETCDGISITCPANATRPNGTTCGGGQCVSGECRASSSPDASVPSDAESEAAPTGTTGGCSVRPARTGAGAASGVVALLFAMLRRRRARRQRMYVAPFLLALACCAMREPATRSYALDCPSQRVRVELSREGASWIDEESGLVSTSTLDRFGRASAMKALDDVAPSKEEKRVVFRRGPLVEWYESQPQGIEQGFDVAERPVGEGPLLLALRGDVGRDRLTYGEVHAFDRGGRALPSRLDRDATHIVIEVDDREALYPITIDPLVWRERQRIVATPPKQGAGFGASIVTQGDLLVVGSPQASDPVAVFQRSGVSFVEVAKLLPVELLSFASTYGVSLAIDGDRIVIGAHFDNGFAGRVYVFERSFGVWKQTATFHPDDDVVGRQLFGRSVALSGDTIVVGAPDEDISGPFSGPGAVYVFRNANGAWSREAKLRGPPPTLQFGGQLSLDKDTLIVTASLCEGGVDFNGDRVYFFERSGTTWDVKLSVGDPARARYGCSTALEGDTAVIGGPFPTIGAPAVTSFVDVYTRTNGVWVKRTRLQPSDPVSNSGFGFSLSLRGQRLAIAAPAKNKGRGAAYLFEGAGDAWAEKQQFVASDGQVDDAFGISLALAKDMLLVGAPQRQLGTGAVYTFFQGLQGDRCTSGDVCASGFCVDEVCCDTACGGGLPNDCQACSVAMGAAKDGVCGPAKGNVCRDVRDDCDVEDRCDGEHLTCPADVVKANGTSCKEGAGVCSSGRCFPIASVSTNDAGAPNDERPSEDSGCTSSGHTSPSAWFVPFLVLGAVAFLRRRRP